MADVIAAAISNGSSQQLTAAVQKFSKGINKQTAFEAYPLHLAVWKNWASAVRQLLEAGAAADVRDGESGWTPLHKALYQGSLEVAALLLAHGCSIELLDGEGRLPLDLVSHDLKQQLRLAAASSAVLDARPALPHQVVVYSNLYSWGNGANFTLGTGSTDLHLIPTRVDLENSEAAPASSSGKGSSVSPPAAVSSAQVGRVVSLAAAKFHSALVTDDGRLFTFGFGRGGRLGHADFHIHSGSSAQILPRAVSGLGRRVVVAVAAAKHHTLVATSAGEVFSFGSNAHGRLGYPAVDSQPTPKKVAALPPRVRIVAVAAANKHSAAVTSSGELFTWGANSSGQLGYGTSDSSCNSTPRLVESLKGKMLVKVSAAKHHTVVLTSDGEVWTFGHKVVTPRKVLLAGSRDTARAAPLQHRQQPGASTTSAAARTSTASDINSSGTGAASTFSTAAVTPDASGSTAAAAVPVGSDQLVFHQGTSDIARPVAVAISAGASHTSCLTRTGVVLVWPSTAVNPRALEVAGPLAGRRVVSLSAGKNRTAVVTDDGQVFMWESREGKKAKKKGTGDAQQQQQQQQGDKVTAAGAAASGGSKQQDVPKKLRPQPAAATDDQRDSQQCQQQAIKGAAVEQSNTAVTADDTATRAVASTVVTPSSSSSRVGMSGSTTSQAGATAAGSSTVAYGSGSSSSGGVVKSLLESWVGPTAPVAPERVHGPRHVTCVAVGEKHSLAVQSWTAPVLPDRAQQHHQMLDFAARHDGSSSSNRSLRQQQSSGQQAAAVDDMSASESSDLGDDVDGYNDAADGVAAAAASISSAYTSIGHQSPARNSSSDGGCQVDISANERSTGTASGRSSSSSSRVCVGPEPLSVICERAVATQLVEPRTAPALLEYADMAGAALLRAYCLSVAVRNLDMLIAEARSAFEQLPRHLLAEMEEFYRQLALKEPPKTQRTAAAQHIAQQDSRTYDSGSGYQAMGESPQQQVTVPNAATAAPIRPTYDLGFHFVIPGGEVVEELEQQQEQQQQQVQQQGAAASKDSVVVSVLQKPHQYLYKRLHPGLRPTRYPDSGAGLAAGAMSAAAAGSAADHALLTAAAARGALAAVHRSWFDQDTTATHGSSAAGSTQQYLGSSSSSSSNFLSGDSGRLAALRAAGQKLDRNLLKKLQQIDVLESRQQQGLVLDSQQLAKLSLKGSILEALSQLRSGAVALDDIQGLLTRAQAVAHKLYLTPAPGAAADDDNDDRAISQQQAPPEQIALDGGSLDHSSSAVMTPPPAAAAAATAASASTSMSKKGSKQHKGDLSVFLTGELEKRAKSAAAAAAADAAASSSKVLPKGPAWGGVSLQAAATSSLKDLLQRVSSTSAPPAVGSSTQASTTQQVAAQSTRPAALGTSRPTAAAAVAAASTATPEATKALVQEHTPSEAGTPVTPAAAKQAVSKTPGGLCSVERSVSSSSSSKQQSALPPVGPSGHHQPSMTAVMQHQVGLTPHSASTSSTSPAASSSGLKLSLMDLVAHKRSSPLTVSKAKSVTTAAAGSSPPAAAAPAWGGVIGSSPPSSSKVSLRDIQLEQEQLRATTGWAAYQRERAAAAAAAGGGMAVGSPAAAKSAAAGPEAVAAVAPSKAFLQMKAAGGLSQALQTAAAAAAGSHKLSSATASPGVHSNSALLGSSPVASGSLSRSFKGGSSSSFTLHGSSPPAPSKWYIRDQPQVRSLTDIQDEEQVMQQQILFMKQIEEQKERERQEQKKKQKQRQRERREHRNNKRQAESSSSTKGVVDDDVVSGTGRESSASSSSRHNGEGERRRPRGASGTSGDLTADADGRAQHQQQQDLAGQQQQQPCQQHHRGQQPVRSAGEDGSGGQSQLARAHTQQQPGRFQQQHAAVEGRRQQQQQQRHRSQHPAVVPGDHQGRSLNQNAGGRQQHGGSRGRGHGRSGNSSGRGGGHREPPDADHPAAAAAAAVGNKVGKGADAATVSGVSGTRNDETGGDSGWSVT